MSQMRVGAAGWLMGALLLGCQSADQPVSEPAARSGYSVVHGWPDLPEGWMLGQVSAVGVDSHNHVFVFHRASRPWSEPFPTTPIAEPTILMWDGDSGQLLASWGAGRFIMPHGLTVDDRDNIWVTDVGLEQVFGFDHDGELFLTLGEAGVAGSDASHFDRPTDVAVRPDGSFYVSDGYRNTRVMLFGADGSFEFEWGGAGSEPGQFDVPHGVDLDDAGRVHVADRGNARVQIFASSGELLGVWQSQELGRPYAVAIGPDGSGFVLDGGELPRESPDRASVLVLDSSGRIRERFGSFGNQDGQFVLAHDLAVGDDGAVYVTDVWGRRIQKFTRKPER